MKILNENFIYKFTVAKIGAIEDVNEFQIDFRYRRFQSASQTPEFEEQRSIRCCRGTTQSFIASVLHEFNVPETPRVDLATHFNFYLERLSRMSSNRGGSIHVSVSLDVKEISAERAAAIGRRRERERESERTSRRVMVDAAVVTLPAKKSVVESLEMERVVAVDDESECAICLEKFGGGVEGIELPCLHIYHKDCIIQWLGRNHFCPFCRFKLPC